ncbi:MAG: ATP-binding protein [Sneathiella sp.]
MEQIEILQARLNREQAARQQAEKLLEEKSRQLFSANQSLKEAAEKISAESLQLSVILDETLFAIILSDAEGKIVKSNKTARHFFSSRDADLVGQEVFRYLYIGENEEAEEDDGLFGMEDSTGPDISSYAAGEVYEAKGQAVDGRSIPMEITVTSLDWGDGEHYMWLCRDISRSKAMEAEKQVLEQELRHGQKLEALGTLASGIAHEINTPIQFISDNISFMQDSFDDLNTLVDGFQDLIGGLGEEQKTVLKEKVEALLEDADYEFLAEEMPSSIEQSREGTKRIAKIVSAIKDFAHPGSEEKSTVDINDAIQTTATVSHNQWKYVSDLSMDLDENLPPIMGYLGDINQVLLNIVVNAAHAIEESPTEGMGAITIATSASDTHVSVSIGDNGCGISKSNIDKIFDPFFTTKEVGKGTGQGLAIIHNIVVNKHGGAVDVSSEEGVGTTFTLKFPRGTVAEQSELVEEIV